MVDSCLNEVFEDLAVEHHDSIQKHGLWDGYNEFQIHKAVFDEYDEYAAALIRGDIHGPHGQRRELLQLANVALKGYMRLGRVGVES